MNELEVFYNQLDQNISHFLIQKENNIGGIVGKAYTELGKELKEAQDKLAGNNQYNGVFEKWFTYLGFKKTFVYKLINRFELVHNMNDQNRELIEELPVSLTYEIAKPSVNEDLKQKVLNGEVKTLKEYKELELKFKKTQEEKNKLQQELQKEKNKPVKVETKIIEKEIDNTDYDSITRLNKQINNLKQNLNSYESKYNLLKDRLEQEQQDAEEYRKMKSEIERLHREKDDLHRQIESATAISGLYVEIEHLLSTKLAPIKYSRALTERRDSEVAMNNLREIIKMVDEWSNEMKSYLPNKNNNYIDAEVIDYE